MALVATVEPIAEVPILGIIPVDVRVEQIDRHAVPRHPREHQAPRAHLDGAPLELEARAHVEALEMIGGVPVHRLRLLRAVRVDDLTEVSTSIQQRDRVAAQAKVRDGAQGVPRQHAEPAAVGGDVIGEPDFHGEVAKIHRGTVSLEAREYRIFWRDRARFPAIVPRSLAGRVAVVAPSLETDLQAPASHTSNPA